MTPSFVFSFSAFKTWTLILQQLYRQWTSSPERSTVPVWPCPALVFERTQISEYVIKKYLLSGIIMTNVSSRCSSATWGKLLLSVSFLCSNYWFVTKVCLVNRSFQHIQIGSYVCGLQHHGSPHQRQFKNKKKKSTTATWLMTKESVKYSDNTQTNRGFSSSAKKFLVYRAVILNIITLHTHLSSHLTAQPQVGYCFYTTCLQTWKQ